MSEHWKSTPKYWCKHCSCYVRDTKLERQNHEATGKHQGALKRFLRDLHRGHEREERDKERAQREIARLNGVVSGSSSSSFASGSGTGSSQATKPSAPTEASLKRQREQLAEMGVDIPTEFHPEMAMPGQWTVTNTRVIEHKPEGEEKVEAKAAGVRKREVTEEQQAEEEAMRGLFKKPRKWGRDTKLMPNEEDKELDALLSISTFKPAEDSEDVKKEDVKEEVEESAVKQEDDTPKEPQIKAEPDAAPTIKTEESAEPGPNVVFKKRKPKNIRQK